MVSLTDARDFFLPGSFFRLCRNKSAVVLHALLYSSLSRNRTLSSVPLEKKIMRAPVARRARARQPHSLSAKYEVERLEKNNKQVILHTVFHPSNHSL